MNMKKIVLSLFLVFPLFAGDIMVERMQSVVDEVSELRKRYEDSVHKNEECLAQLKEQNTLLSKKGLTPKVDKEKLEALSFENTRLKQAHETAKRENIQLKELESKVEKLNKENTRLNTSAQILVDKNQSLLEQLNKLKRNKEAPANVLVLTKDKERLKKELSVSNKKVKKLEAKNRELEVNAHTAKSTSNTKEITDLQALEKENKELSNALESCKNTPKTYAKKVKTTKGVCVDDNPFPKLLKKEKKTAVKQVQKTPKSIKKEVKTSGVYRIKGESAVYNKPEGEVVEVWEDTRSFTSNVSKDNWVKITGYFVNRKWKKSTKELWVKKENTKIR